MNGQKNEFIEKLYRENLWVTDRHYELLCRLAAENQLSDSELAALVEEHSTKAKKEFARSFQVMRDQRAYYSVPVRIFPTGEDTQIIISCKYRHQRLAGSFRVVISPYYNYSFRPSWDYQAFSTVIEAADDQLCIPYRFDHEDLYTLHLFYLLDGRELPFLSASVYALEPDLYGCGFYKADLHMHTTYSDGYEPPALAAASAREYGMDIIAVTDHNNFYGSVHAREEARKMGLDLTVILGEEYSLTYSPMHILALGTEEPVDRKYITHEALELPETQKILAEHRELSCDPEVYACTQALLDRVAEMGGISILAHPYWKPIQPDGSRIDTPENVYIELGKDRRFAGIELVSGSREHQFHVSNLQASLARTILGSFDGFPIIGITDSHQYTTDDISGKHFTVIFARSKEEKDVLDALRAGRCIAVDLVNGNPLCFGEHRLAKLTDFLVRHYFPERDKTAQAEARAAKEKYLLRN